MTEKLNIGIIGTSWWTELMFLPSIKSHPLANLVSICGRTKKRATELAKEYDIAKVYTDYRDLIADKSLQAVIIATPDDLHYPMTMAALEAGLNVLCEKPLANNAAQAREMFDQAEKLTLKHMVLFTWRWMPHFQYMKHLLAEEYVGRVLHGWECTNYST